MKSIPEEIAELRAMKVAELVERYEAVFGTPPRVKHRDWLWRRVAWKIQEQKYGGLSIVARRRLDGFDRPLCQFDGCHDVAFPTRAAPHRVSGQPNGEAGGKHTVSKTIVKHYYYRRANCLFFRGFLPAIAMGRKGRRVGA